MPMRVSVKWLHEGQYRRFGLDLGDKDDSFVQLRNRLSSLVPNFDKPVAWKDSDGDVIVIKSDLELREAVRDSKDMLLRVATLGEIDSMNSAATTPLAPPQQPKNDAAAPPAAENRGPQRHDGVFCDGDKCDKRPENEKGPIVGVRFKCIGCQDYDLCEKCEAEGKHRHHPMLRITDPSDNSWKARKMRKALFDHHHRVHDPHFKRHQRGPHGHPFGLHPMQLRMLVHPRGPQIRGHWSPKNGFDCMKMHPKMTFGRHIMRQQMRAERRGRGGRCGWPGAGHHGHGPMHMMHHMRAMGGGPEGPPGPPGSFPPPPAGRHCSMPPPPPNAFGQGNAEWDRSQWRGEWANWLAAVGEQVGQVLNNFGVDVDVDVENAEGDRQRVVHSDKKQSSTEPESQDKDKDTEMDTAPADKDKNDDKQESGVVGAKEATAPPQQMQNGTDWMVVDSEGDVQVQVQVPQPPADMQTIVVNYPKLGEAVTNTNSTTESATVTTTNTDMAANPGLPQHKDQLTQHTLDHLKAMGFNDDNGWLTSLVQSKNGDINAVLNAMHPNK